MSFFLVKNNQLVGSELFTLPASGAQRVDTGQWITPVGGNWTEPEFLACGYQNVELTVKPADTAGGSYQRSIGLIGGKPKEVWTFVAYPQSKIDQDAVVQVRQIKLQDVKQSVAWLRNRAAAADAVTVTPGNAVAVAQSLCDDLAIFLSRFADYIEAKESL